MIQTQTYLSFKKKLIKNLLFLIQNNPPQRKQILPKIQILKKNLNKKKHFIKTLKRKESKKDKCCEIANTIKT